MKALWLQGAAGLWLMLCAGAAAPRLAPAVYADYDAELREATARADGIKHVDTPALLAKLRAGNIKTYAYLVWHQPTDWDDFRYEFLPAAQLAGIEVWLYLTPPSENHPPEGYVPYGSNYVAWATNAAALASRYPVLKALAMDDFNSNVGLFTSNYVWQMMAAAHLFNSNLVFLPVNYDFSHHLSRPLDTISPAFARNYGPSIGGVIFPYLNWTNKDDYSDEAAQIAHNSDCLNGKLAQFLVRFPSDTRSLAGDYSALTRVLTNSAGFPDAPYPFAFRWHDDYGGPTSGYHKLQLRVDSTLVWEGDTAGALGLQNVALNLQPQIKGKRLALLTMRFYEAKGVSNYKVTLTCNLPAGNWALSESGALAGCGNYYPGHPENPIPLVVMIYDGGYGSGTNRWVPTTNYVAQANRIAQSSVLAGNAVGIIQYCLNKAVTSQQFPIIRDLYGQWAFEPRFSGLTRQANGTVGVAGTNGGPNISYTLEAADNLGAPATAWLPLATNRFDAGGGFTNLDGTASAHPRRFYRISVP